MNEKIIGFIVVFVIIIIFLRMIWIFIGEYEEQNTSANKIPNDIYVLKEKFFLTEQGKQVKKSIENFNLNIQNTFNDLDIVNEEVVVSQLEFENVLLRPYEYLIKRFNFPVSEQFVNDLKQKIEKYYYIYSQIKKIEEIKVNYENGFILTFEDMAEDIRYSTYTFYNQRSKKISYTGQYLYLNSKIITLNIDTMNDIIKHIEQKISKVRKNKEQRKLMTPELREQVLIRDNYTCQKCGISREDEPNLLLEVDHIIPIAKGGITELDNLQTLCWKCNRQKGSK